MSTSIKISIFFGLILLALILFAGTYFLYRKQQKRILLNERTKEDFWNRLINVMLFSFVVLGFSSIVSAIYILT